MNSHCSISYLHAARGLQHGWKSRVEQISTFPLKVLINIPRIYFDNAYAWSVFILSQKYELKSSVVRAADCVLRTVCCVEVWIGLKLFNTSQTLIFRLSLSFPHSDISYLQWHITDIRMWKWERKSDLTI